MDEPKEKNLSDKFKGYGKKKLGGIKDKLAKGSGSAEPKIDLVAIIVIGQFLIIGEVIDGAADLLIAVPGLNIVALAYSRLYGGILSIFIICYLMLKGVGIHWYLGGTFLGIVIPGGRTGAFIATVLEDHAPQKIKKAAHVLEKIDKMTTPA